MENRYASITEAVIKQEEILRFPSFTNDDAWKIGCLMTEEIRERGIELAVAVKKINGCTMFHYSTAGTSLLNEKWMTRKFNAVCLNETSSFLAWAKAAVSGEGPVFAGLSDEDYIYCGGGFPIKLQNGELVGVILASNLPHQQDHQFLANVLAKYLGKEVPDVCPLFEEDFPGPIA